MSNVKSGFFEYKEKKLPVTYYTDLSIQKKIDFVNNVCNLTVIGNMYYPFLKELIIRYAIIDVFTDIDVKDVMDLDPECEFGLEEMEELVNNTNLCDLVIVDMKDGLYDELYQAIEDNIEYKTGIHKNEISIALGKLLTTIDEKLYSVDTKEVNGIFEKLKKIAKNLTMDNMIEAYTKSDAFKNNQADIIKAKDEEIKKLRSKINEFNTRNVQADIK